MKVLPITLERYFPFIRDRANEVILLARSPHQCFTPFSPDRKETDSCVIGNGIPKSGTYLIASILNNLGKWENIGIHVNPTHWDELRLGPDGGTHRCLAQFSVQKLRNGQMVAGHLPWSKGLESSIAQVTNTRRMKHVMIYRDPRDTLVSYMNFVAYPERYSGGTNSTPEQRFLREEFSNDDDRLGYIINQRMGYYLPGNGKGPRYLNFEPWLHSAHCYAVKFEQIYPELRKLKENGFGDVLKGLLNYLEIDDTRVNPVDFYDNVYGKSPTASSEQDKVGQYKRVFKIQHYDLLDNPDFKSLLHTFGYEW